MFWNQNFELVPPGHLQKPIQKRKGLKNALYGDEGRKGGDFRIPQTVLIKKKLHVCALVFGIFDAFSILNGYLLDAQVKRARDSGSETSVKKLNWTYTTNLTYRTLCIVFFGSPCTWLLSVVKLSFIYFALVVPKHAEQILFMTSGKICVNLDIIFDN